MKKIILLLIILTIFLYGCFSDPERLAPPKDFKTGSANYLSMPLDTNKLANEGYRLEKGWNIFVWPGEYDGFNVVWVLESIQGSYYYIYDYDVNEFYFPSDGKYSVLNDHKYYGSRLFYSLQSMHRYSIYMIKEDVLIYS